MNEEELLDDFVEIINKIIHIRQYTDKFLESGKHSTFRGDVAVESDNKIEDLAKQADLILVMLTDLDESSTFVKRMKNMLNDLME